MKILNFLWQKRNQESFEAALLRFINTYHYHIDEQLRDCWYPEEYPIENFRGYAQDVQLKKQWWTGQYIIKSDLVLVPECEDTYSHYLLKELTMWLASKDIMVTDINKSNIVHYVRLLDIYVNNVSDFTKSVEMWKTLQYVDVTDVTIPDEEELML